MVITLLHLLVTYVTLRNNFMMNIIPPQNIEGTIEGSPPFLGNCIKYTILYFLLSFFLVELYFLGQHLNIVPFFFSFFESNIVVSLV